MLRKPFVSVVVVSWNTKEITDKCLKCLNSAIGKSKSVADIEVLVVENDSSDGSYEMIKRKHPWVKLFASGSDLGYGKGNNYGFKRISPKSDYVLLLNNDAFVRDDTFVKAVEFMTGHKECDVLGCRLEYLDGRFQPSAGDLPTPLVVWGWLWNFSHKVHPKNPEYFQADREVGWVMGAFLFMKKQVFSNTRGFDENFFMYMEEVEWCFRAKNLGYRIFYTPSFSVTHVDKASAFNDPVQLAKIYYREIMGLKYFLQKHFNSAGWWLRPLMIVGVFARWVSFSLLGNKFRSGAYFKLLKDL